MMKLVENPRRGPELIAQLLIIWERSVQATHTFLSGEEIAKIKPYVPQVLEQVPHLIVLEDEGGAPAAFMGIGEQKLEMLFLSPEVRGKGHGKRLLQYGIERYAVQEVTVNEQNPQAIGFYEHMGFQTYRRTWGFRPTGARSGTSRAGRIRCCICGACCRTFHLRDGFRGTFRSPYGAFRRGRPQISPRAAQCAAPTDLIRLAALGTCPYPFCPFGTFPPDRGNRPKGEGFEIVPALPFRGRCPRRGRMRYPAPGALAEKTQAQKWNRNTYNFCRPRAQWPGRNSDQPLRFCAPEILRNLPVARPP